MEDKTTTIDDLAKMINEGFKTTATKDDVTALRSEMNEKFDVVNSHLNTLDARVGRIEADVHALRDEMVHRREFEDVLDRVKYI